MPWSALCRHTCMRHSKRSSVLSDRAQVGCHELWGVWYDVEEGITIEEEIGS
jgi:hypothetical protein